MEFDLERAREHFAAGRTDQAIECLINTASFPEMSSEQIRQLVEVKSVDDLVPWCRRTGTHEVTFESHKRPPNALNSIWEIEGDAIISRTFPINDEDAAVFAIPNATVAAGAGVISTEDGKIIQIAPDWGEEAKTGVRARRAYGGLCVRDENDEVLTKRLPRITSLPEAIYLWVGCRHFGINLVNVINVALLREALGETDLPLVAQRKGMPPRQFELDAIRRMGFTNNQIITVDNRPTTFVEKLWVPYSPITFFPHHILSCSAAMNIFRRRLGITDRSKSTPGERIYVTRRDAQWRLIEDEEAYITMLRRKYDFRVVEFTGLELEQRIEALANAEVILGSTGQNLFNMMFAPPDCLIAEILPVTHKGAAVRDAIAHMGLSMGHRILRIPCDTRQTDEPWIRWNLILRDEALHAGLQFLEHQTSSSPRAKIAQFQ
jgi:hypothetical protein